MRKKPANADLYGWVQFERWGDKNGIGTLKADWAAWWDCWRAGYIAAMNA